MHTEIGHLALSVKGQMSYFEMFLLFS